MSYRSGLKVSYYLYPQDRNMKKTWFQILNCQVAHSFAKAARVIIGPNQTKELLWQKSLVFLMLFMTGKCHNTECTPPYILSDYI